MCANNASLQKPWILDSGVSSHMTGIKHKFVSLNFFNKFSPVNIADGTQSPASDNVVVQATPYLTLTDVLYVPKFSVSLLSISQFTKHNNCKITFSLLIVCFRTCRLGRGLVRGIREETCII